MEKENKGLSLNGSDEISGYLHKRRGGFGKHMPNAWQPRYFIVRDGWMYYFEDKKQNARPRGKIDLKSEVVTLVVNLHFEHSPTPYTMLINPGGYEEKWRLCAANSSDMEQWCSCIKSHINNKKKRKTAELNLPAYDSDNEHEDEPEVNEDAGVMIDRLPQAPPALVKKIKGKLSSPTKKKKKKRDYTGASTSDSRPSSSNAPLANGNANPHDSIKTKSSGHKLKVKIKNSGDTDTMFEIVVTLVVVNLCVLYALLTHKLWLRILYFVIGNIVAGRTMYLFSKRIEKMSREIKSVISAKEKIESTMERSSARLNFLEDVVKQSDDVNHSESESSVAKVPPVPGKPRC